jgi:hypothetical protein
MLILRGSLARCSHTAVLHRPSVSESGRGGLLEYQRRKVGGAGMQFACITTREPRRACGCEAGERYWGQGVGEDVPPLP